MFNKLANFPPHGFAGLQKLYINVLVLFAKGFQPQWTNKIITVRVMAFVWLYVLDVIMLDVQPGHIPLGLHLLTINTFSAYNTTPIQCHGNISVWLPSCVLRCELRCQHGCLVTANKFNNPLHVRKQRCKITYSPSLSYYFRYIYIIKVDQSIVSAMTCISKNQRNPINAPLGGEVESQKEIKAQRSVV